jgi:hypothetical protein
MALPTTPALAEFRLSSPLGIILSGALFTVVVSL